MNDESGFSLAELLVAVLITLLVTGAVFGLMSGGSGAFRREPALTDRQQNIRLAMELLAGDVALAGTGVGAFTQAFADGLDGVGPAGPQGNTDFIEILGDNGECPSIPSVPGNETSGANINFAMAVPSCYTDASMVLVLYPGMAKPAFAHNIHASNKKINFPPGQQPSTSWVQSVADLTCPGPPGACPPASSAPPIGIVNLGTYRWQVAPEADGVPGLWRSSKGGIDSSGCGGGSGTCAFVGPPSAAGGWQLVARGVEDMQVRYMTHGSYATQTWTATPGAVGNGDYASVVRQVEITLGARTTTGGRLQGETTAGGVTAVRGQLRTVVTPRAAVLALSQAGLYR